jgi:hypothetical protein
MGNTTTQFTFNVQNASTVIATNQAGTPVVDTPRIHSLTYVENASPEYLHRRGATTLGSGNTTAAPVTSVSTAVTLRLGATGTPSSQARARWVCSLVAPRVISDAELAVVHEWVRVKYGVAA